MPLCADTCNWWALKFNHNFHFQFPETHFSIPLSLHLSPSFSIPSVINRTTWNPWTKKSGTTSDENHQQSPWSCHIQCRGAKETALLQSYTGKTARTSIAQCARNAANFLFEIGRSCGRSSAHREHVFGQFAVLNVHIVMWRFDVIYRKPTSQMNLGFLIFFSISKTHKCSLILFSEWSRKKG